MEVRDVPLVKFCPICLIRSHTTPLCAATASSSCTNQPPESAACGKRSNL